MTAPIYYNYQSGSGEYIGSVSAAIDPLATKKSGQTVYLGPPAHATPDAPPLTGVNQVAAYNNGWSVVPDHRGTVYWLPDGTRHEISDIGIEPPENALTEEPVMPPTDVELLATMERLMEQHMDATAQADGWDDRWSCVARAGYPNVWQSKAMAFGQWMDNCWLTAIQIRDNVLAGTRSIPTESELLAELPEMVWPVWV